LADTLGLVPVKGALPLKLSMNLIKINTILSKPNWRTD